MRLKQINNSFVLEKEEGEENKLFPIRDDLEKALLFLKNINQIQTQEGVCIYNLFLYKNYSTWSFDQGSLFWNRIRFFVQAYPLIGYLYENDIKEIMVESVDSRFVKVLTMVGIICHGKEETLSIYRRAKIFAFTYGNVFLAKLSTNICVILSRILRVAFVLFTPDNFYHKTKCDFRFAPVYSYLRENKIPFTEILHTIFDKKFTRNFFKRLRPVVYLEACRPAFKKYERIAEYPTLKLGMFSGPERKFIENEVKDFYVVHAKKIDLIHGLKKKIKFTRIKRLVAMDDLRYVNELIIACRENGVETVGIQHGHFTKYLVSWMNYNIPKDVSVTFDTLYLWNTYWQKVLCDYSTQYDMNNTSICGVLREHAFFYKEPSVATTLSELKIMVSSEPWSIKAEVGTFIDDLTSQGVTVFLSVRPDNQISDVLAPYALLHPERVKLLTTQPDETFLKSIDAVAGTYSTFLNEMMYFNFPILIFDTSMHHGHRIIEDNLALVVKKGEYQSIVEYVKSVKNNRDIVWPNAPLLNETLKKILVQ